MATAHASVRHLDLMPGAVAGWCCFLGVSVVSSWFLSHWARLFFGVTGLVTVLAGGAFTYWLYVRLDRVDEAADVRPSITVEAMFQVLKERLRLADPVQYQRPMLISRSVDDVLLEIVVHVVDDFFVSWYKQLAFQTESQADLVRNELWEAMRRFKARLTAIDEVNFIAKNIFNKLKHHFQMVRITQESNSGATASMLAPYLTSPEREHQFLRNVADVAMAILLPSEYCRCPPVRNMLREMLACTVLQPAVQYICDPDFINQKLHAYLHGLQMWRELHEKTYSYAASYEDFIRVIQQSNDLEELKHIRYSIVAEIVQASTVNNLTRTRSMKPTRDSRLPSASKGDLLQARNLKRYINQLSYAKTQCEKRIKSLGGDDYLTEIESPESSDAQLVGKKVLSFGVIMESAYTRRYLRRYLELEAQEGLVDFWNKVNELKVCPKQMTHALGADVYQTYLAGRRGVIKLDRISLKRIESFLIGDRGPDIFFELQDEVQQQLENMHYHGFLMNPLYNKMMVDAEESGIDFINATVASKDADGARNTSEVGDTNLSDHSSFAILKLDQLNEKISTKAQALDAIRAVPKPDMKMATMIEQEIKTLTEERIEWEAHIERTDLWAEHLGNWSADVHSAEVLEDKDMPVFVLIVYLVSPAKADMVTSCILDGHGDRSRRSFDDILDHHRGWIVIRRLSDLRQLHAKLCEISPRLKAVDVPALPSKMIFSRNCDRAFLDRAKLKVQKYLNIILADEKLNKSEVIYTFLSPSSEHLLFPGSSGKKTNFFSVFKSVARMADDDATADSDDDDVLFLDNDVRPMLRDDFAEPLYSLIAEIFDLSGKWLRKTLISFVQLTYHRTISLHIRDTITWCLCERQLLYYFSSLRDTCWPQGQRASLASQRSEAQKEYTRRDTRELLINNLPELMVNILGLDNSRLGALKAFETLQDVRLNKNLFYACLEEFLQELMPEIHRSRHNV